jgi:murein L,D-transpeptidase YafK
MYKAYSFLLKQKLLLQLILTLHCSLLTIHSISQPPQKDFIAQQKSNRRVSDAFKAKEDSLKKQFAEKGIEWPAKYMYIRSFKYDGQLEVWVKNERKEPYKLFKTYKVCALAGTLGPKRIEGDYQVPEGFYYINEFRPNSNYHLALGVNYPNASDRVLSDSLSPGSAIYVHGSCVTVGCIPITNDQIEDLYIIASTVHNSGQEFIPIHVFPVSFKNKKSMEYLDKFIKMRPEYEPMMERLKYAYYYFDQKKTIPIVMVDKAGNYLFADEPKLAYQQLPPPKKVVVAKQATQVDFNESEISKSIYRQAVYAGGNKEFQVFLNNLATELSPLLPEERSRAFVQVEFVVTKEGKLILPKVISGANPEMNNLIIDRFEAMPQWQPASNEKGLPIAVRLQQTIEVNAVPAKKT